MASTSYMYLSSRNDLKSREYEKEAHSMKTIILKVCATPKLLSMVSQLLRNSRAFSLKLLICT